MRTVGLVGSNVWRQSGLTDFLDFVHRDSVIIGPFVNILLLKKWFKWLHSLAEIWGIIAELVGEPHEASEIGDVTRLRKVSNGLDLDRVWSRSMV